MSVLPSYMYAHHEGAWCPRRSKEGIRLLGTGVKSGCKEVWLLGIEPRSSAEQQVLLTAETSLQPHKSIIFVANV